MNMLDSLKKRRDALANSTSLAYDILRDKPGVNLTVLMQRCIKPKEDDLRNQRWSELSSSRIQALEAAYRNNDFESALQNGQLMRPVVPTLGEERFLTLLDESHELEGLRKVLGWLHSFQKCVAMGNTVQTLNDLGSLGVNNPKRCDCYVDETFRRCPSLNWVHGHHQEFNRAAWEILSAQPNAIIDLGTALEADIAGRRKRMGTRLYGQILSIKHARSLRANFITSRPSRLWVGASPRPS